MKIHLAHENIDAELDMMPVRRTSKRFRVSKQGDDVRYERYLVFDANHRDEIFLNSANITDELKNKDEEIDPELLGKRLTRTTRVAVDKEYQPVYNYKLYDVIILPDGEIRERPHVNTIGNINKPTPVMITEELVDPKELALNYVFRLSYQIVHNSGVTYSFLYDLAKRLDSSGKLARVIAFNPETKKPEPLILVDGGRKFPRAFLQGKIKGASYSLTIHLSDQELKLSGEG